MWFITSTPFQNKSVGSSAHGWSCVSSWADLQTDEGGTCIEEIFKFYVERIATSDTCIKFKPIPLLNNLYEISEDGEQFYYKGTGKIRKLDMNDSGYKTVSLDNKRLGLRKKRFYIAHLVADAWIGSKPEGYQVDHIDRDRTNNHYKNLRYVSPATNARNSKQRGAIAVSLINGDNSWDFPSLKKAACFIERQTGRTRAMPKLVAGRQYVYGYKVIYADNRTALQPRRRVIQLSLF